MIARELALVSLLGMLSCTAAMAEDALPQRKAGLWEGSMQVTGMPVPGGMASRQCVDAKTDAEMQRKGMSGGRDSQCRQTSIKRSAGQIEIQTDCTSSEGKSHIVSTLTGDFQNRYRMENKMSFDPPRQGMSEAHMTMEAKYMGACPPDMKPGDIRMANGMTMNPAQGQVSGAPGMPAGMDLNKLKSMSPEEMKAMAEQMKKSMAPKP
jgi:hypothetical protein